MDPEAICCIGRANQNTVVLEDDMVSRYHAVIQRTENGDYLLADLGSRNGTFVNGTRDHTALGDAVNRAFRLEAATREFHCDIVLGGDAYLSWRLTN